MQFHHLQRQRRRQSPRYIGRGGKRGKTAGRGTKGQKARAGYKIRPEIRDVIKRIPKRRGYRFQSFQERPAVVNLGRLAAVFPVGARVTPAELVAKGLVRARGGVPPVVKILGGGALRQALTISGCFCSASARRQIEVAGGAVK